MKTIFYKTISRKDKEKANFWFDSLPSIEWFTLDNVLYEPNGSIIKRTIGSDNIIHEVVINSTQDTFSDEGIIRRIALFVSEY